MIIVVSIVVVMLRYCLWVVGVSLIRMGCSCRLMKMKVKMFSVNIIVVYIVLVGMWMCVGMCVGVSCVKVIVK